MPRYFINMSDSFAAHDDEGLVLSGPDELARIVRQTLAAILHDEGVNSDRVEFTAEAHDDTGQRVLTVKATLMTHGW